MTPGKGMIHRSLICSLIKAEKMDILEECLIMVKDSKKLAEQLSTADVFGKTPLHFAIDKGRYCDYGIKPVAILLRYKAKLDIKDQNGETPLHSCIGKFSGNERICEALIAAGSPMSVQDGSRNSLMHTVVINSNINTKPLEIMDLIIKNKAPIDLVNSCGRTPLGETIWLSKISGHCCRNLIIAKKLIDSGADINLKDRDGQSYLHLAASKGYVELLKLLVERGTEVNQTNASKQSPLHEAVKHGFEEAVQYLLDNGANPNQLDEKSQTPLHDAVDYELARIVEQLLNNGASINLQNNYKKTPLHIAIESENTDSTRLLLKHRPNLDIEDHCERTPLLLCMTKPMEVVSEIVVHLLQYGASTAKLNDYLPENKVCVGQDKLLLKTLWAALTALSNVSN